MMLEQQQLQHNKNKRCESNISSMSTLGEREKNIILSENRIKRTKSYRFEDNFSFHDDTDDDSMRITSRIPPNTGFTSCFICDEKGNGNQIEQMQFFFRFLYTHR